MSEFLEFKDFSFVTAMVHRGANEEIIVQAKEAGAAIGFVTASRGTLKREKKLLFSGVSVSPAMEIIQFMVPNTFKKDVINAIVEGANVDMSGAGAVYARPATRVWSIGDSIVPKTGTGGTTYGQFTIHEGLTSITCICQRGRGDIISEAAMEVGSPGPVVFFGTGRGVRERLGILRIAVNPEKELIKVVVGEVDEESVFEAMVDAGRLDTPGMGFIYTEPVSEGLVNIMTYASSNPQTATHEQIVKAIDELKGNQNWRLTGSVKGSTAKTDRKYLRNLVNLKCIVRRGLGMEYTSAAMQVGAPGATISYANLIGGEKVESLTGRVVSDEREVIDLIIGEDKVEPIVEALKEVTIRNDSKNAFFFALPVPKALTYLG